MNKLVRNALAVVLFTGVAVPVGYSAAQAGTTETGCHDIVEGSSASFNNVIKSAKLQSDPLIGDATIKKEYYADAGVVHAEMMLAAESCTTATYTIVVESIHADQRGKHKLFRELALPGDGASSTLTFDGFIDVYTGYTDEAENKCVQVSLRVQDATGRTIDIAPNSGEDPVHWCKGVGDGQAYGG